MKKARMMIGLLPILILICVPFQSQGILQGERPRMTINSITAFVERGPIEILNDTAFDLYGFDGSGTQNDPYLIHGINITSDLEALITIEDTTKHFRINNSILNCLGSNNQAIYV